MIRYDISATELAAFVENEKAGWIDRARVRTQALVDAGAYSQGAPNWSDIKPVFMDFQFGKCVFCERLLGDRQYSRIAHDLEHFRPKSKVTAWPKRNSSVSFDYFIGDASPTGYHWLAYDLKNYAASCKVCNSTLKSAAFPVFGNRGSDNQTVSQLVRLEKQVLCYPIGRSDEDPSTLVEFVGTTARPRGQRGNRKRRGEVIIEFFKLNERDELHVERAQKIALLGGWLKQIERGDDVARHEQLVNDGLSDNQTHAACSRDFVETWFADTDFARRLVVEAEDLVVNRPELIRHA